jgi:hypothetical protein
VPRHVAVGDDGAAAAEAKTGAGATEPGEEARADLDVVAALAEWYPNDAHARRIGVWRALSKPKAGKVTTDTPRHNIIGRACLSWGGEPQVKRAKMAHSGARRVSPQGSHQQATNKPEVSLHRRAEKCTEMGHFEGQREAPLARGLSHQPFVPARMSQPRHTPHTRQGALTTFFLRPALIKLWIGIWQSTASALPVS